MQKMIKPKDLDKFVINSAYFSKDVYEGKSRYAGKKMYENSLVDTLTEEQHNALSKICSARHQLHINIDKSIRLMNTEYQHSLIDANHELEESGLPSIEEIPTTEDDFIDIDNIELLEDMGESPDKYTDDEDELYTEEYQEWYDENYNRIYNELEELNNIIEKYLRKIDIEYGTEYAPTGMSRNF